MYAQQMASVDLDGDKTPVRALQNQNQVATAHSQ